MKTFYQFMEQIPLMRPMSAAEQRSKDAREHDRRVSLRGQRRHAYHEMEKKEAEERNKPMQQTGV